MTHGRIYGMWGRGTMYDVYEEEEGIFFQDLSESGLQDDILARLITFPNVVITSHQAFLTKEALKNIAETTLHNLASIKHSPRIKEQLVLQRVEQITL